MPVAVPKKPATRATKPKVPGKRKPKSLTKTLIEENDALVRKILKCRDPYCVCCGKHESVLPVHGNIPALCVGHYYRRGKMRLRWDLRNVHRQCSACNYRHEQDQSAYNIFMLATYTHEELMELAELARNSRPLKVAELQKINEDLKVVLERVQDGN